MATKRSKQNPYRWSNGTYHSRPERGGAKKPPMASFKPAPVKQGGPKLAPATSTLKPIGPSASVLPIDPQYEAAKVSAARNLQLSNADYTYETGRLKQEYGLEDLSNPFSQAALLRESKLRADRTTTNSMAAAGQQYSGAAQRAMGENARNYSIADDQMRRSYADQMHGLQRGQLGAYANYGTSLTAADWTRLMNQFGGGR